MSSVLVTGRNLCSVKKRSRSPSAFIPRFRAGRSVLLPAPGRAGPGSCFTLLTLCPAAAATSLFTGCGCPRDCSCCLPRAFIHRSFLASVGEVQIQVEDAAFQVLTSDWLFLGGLDLPLWFVATSFCARVKLGLCCEPPFVHPPASRH